MAKIDHGKCQILVHCQNGKNRLRLKTLELRPVRPHLPLKSPCPPRMDGNSPLFYRTLSPLGPLPCINFNKKDGPEPVMISSTLCPAVHILSFQNVYSRAVGIADRYWPWAVFFIYSLGNKNVLKLLDRWKK